MLARLGEVNPHQRALVVDPNPYVAARCPRRAGKSYAGTASALIVGESKPAAISLIISLNLKQLKRLYWAGGPSGLFTLNNKYELGLEFNSTEHKWTHQNGSIGYLLGADDDEQLEVIRGMEADLYLIDECKSFNPRRLRTLIDDIIEPQRSSRQGRVIMIGTPGHLATGPFYEATCDLAVDKKGRNFFVRNGKKDPHGRKPDEGMLWSLHEWTMEDNSVKPLQWRDAKRKKAAKGWSDNHPTWLREYLGQWTSSNEGLVYRYAEEKAAGHVTWSPVFNDKAKHDPVTGLPLEGAPWRLIGGLDLGFEAPTAFVVAAYSRRLRQLRVIHDDNRSHMLAPDVADMIRAAMDRFGPLEQIFADVGNLGKMLVETMRALEGLPLVRADKREKNDYIELLNGAFSRGEVLVIEGTTLEHQLLTNAWDLGSRDRDEDGPSVKQEVARTSRLVEDKSIPNDSTDALVYMYRGSLHHFGGDVRRDEPEPYSPEWVKHWEADQLRVARERLRQGPPHLRRSLEQKRLPHAVTLAASRRLAPPRHRGLQ